jgi:soluble lytic murein transglycosylase-like protein
MKVKVLGVLFACLLTASVVSAEKLPDDPQFDSLYLATAEGSVNEQPKDEAVSQQQQQQPQQEQSQDTEQVVSDNFVQKLGAHIADSSGLGYDYGVYLASLIINYSNDYGVDPVLAASLFEQESRFKMESISNCGAIGITQLMPSTAAGMGYNPYILEDNVRGGIEYLSYQLKRFSTAGDLQASFAVAAYNAGAGAVQKYGDVPPYSETRNHVTAIANYYYQISSLLG